MQHIGEKGKKFMKQDDIYTDDVDWSLGKQVKDFLPSPSQLVKKQEMQRITMEVPKETINFFKQKAKEHGGSYQLMIRELLMCYVKNYTT